MKRPDELMNYLAEHLNPLDYDDLWGYIEQLEKKIKDQRKKIRLQKAEIRRYTEDKHGVKTFEDEIKL